MTELPAPHLPSLDYAYLADYAAVQSNGTLTAVGASFTWVQAPSLPAGRQIAIAGRIRVAEGSGLLTLSIDYRGPTEATPSMGFALTLNPEGERAYQGRAGVLFAVNTTIPLFAEGLHIVSIKVDEELVRELAFSVELAAQ